MRYFSGHGHELGTVSALPQSSFLALCTEVFLQPVRLGVTAAEFAALPKRDKDAPTDQGRVKRVQYVTPSAFPDSPCTRRTEQATKCNLIFLDIDSAEEAKRLLSQRWDDCLGDLGYLVYQTISSTPKSPRLRVVVNAEGIPASRYSDAVRTIAELIGLSAITHESRVVVQPMFLPTIFADTTDWQPVAQNIEGEAFTVADIIGTDESSLVDSSRPADDTLGDLEYLRLPLENITLQDAEEALATLDPDLGMQQWIEVAAGLKHQFNSEEAYALWDAWSAKGKKYESAAETKYRWDSLKAQPTDRHPITIRSMFKMAQARGWSNPTLAARQHADTLSWFRSPARSTEELLDQGPKRIARVSPLVSQLERKLLLVAMHDGLSGRGMKLPMPDLKKAVQQLEREAARTSGVQQWAKGLCFVTSVNQFYRPTTDRKFTPEVLDLMYSVPPIGDEPPLSPRHYCIQVANVPQVEALRYEPAMGSKRFFSEGGIPYVNTYRADFPAGDPLRADEAGEIFLDHIRKLIAEPEYQTVLIDYLSYLVQHPGRKIRWAVLIQGAEGCGKSSIAEIMRAVLGRRNVTKLNALDVMAGAFNDWAYGSQLAVMEEVRVVGNNRHAVMDKLKPCITDDYIGLNMKFENKRTVPNITNYLMFTNYHDSLAIREDGRRYFVIASPLQSAPKIAAIGGKAHFDRLYSMIRDNAAGLRAWFERWTISPEFNPEGRAPVTKYLKELADNAASPLMAAVRHAIEDEPHALVRSDLLSLSCLRGVLSGQTLPDFSDQALASVLRELGWEKRERVLLEGIRHTLWSKNFPGDVRSEAGLRLEFL